MNFDDLEKLKCRRLQIEKLHFDNETNERLKWMEQLDKNLEELRIDFSDAGLEERVLKIPVFEDEELIDFSYLDDKGILYESRANCVKILVQYDFLSLLHITRFFGLNVLKPTEEMHLNFLRFDKEDLYFRYDYVKEQWTKDQDEKLWNKDRLELEEQKKELQSDATKGFFHLRKVFSEYQKSDRLRSVARTCLSSFELLENVLDAAFTYQKTKNFILKINQVHFDKITADIDTVKEYLKKAKDLIVSLNDDNDPRCKTTLASAISEVKRVIITPGYWIIGNEIYPNIAEQYELLQKANTNRNESTKALLKKTIFEMFNESPNTYADKFILTSNPTLLGKLKAKKK